jgi:hypothetical protein
MLSVVNQPLILTVVMLSVEAPIHHAYLENLTPFQFYTWVILLHVSKHFVIVASLLNKSSTLAQALCVTIFANMQTDMILITFCFAA